MPRRERGDVREFILSQLAGPRHDLTGIVSQHFGFSRQEASRHVRKLVKEGLIQQTGRTRASSYESLEIAHRKQEWVISPALAEDVVFTEIVRDQLANEAENIREICQYGLTEMINNVIDHSEGSRLVVEMQITTSHLHFVVSDNGVGIFKKIADGLNLPFIEESVLELAKGKVTTDQSRHTGEGIYFTSKAFEDFFIVSGQLRFLGSCTDSTEMVFPDQSQIDGTYVYMAISRSSRLSLAELFQRFTTDQETISFDKTQIPLNLAKIGIENLVSRSQAKRVMSRAERFKVVHLDFGGIEFIGQAFADEIFRVFQRNHPETELVPHTMTPQVRTMVLRARAAFQEERDRELMQLKLPGIEDQFENEVN